MDVIGGNVAALFAIVELLHVPPFGIAVVVDATEYFDLFTDVQRENAVDRAFEVVQRHVDLDENEEEEDERGSSVRTRLFSSG